MENMFIKKFLNIGAALGVVIVIICIAVSITILARPLYYFDINYLSIPENSGISAEACKLNYDVLIDYNLIGGSDELVFPTLRMSEEGRIHFEEVKNIFIPMQIISIAGVILLLIWIAFFKKKGNNLYYYLWMKYTAIFSVVAALTVCISMAINWEWSFTTMHNILFDNDYWIFNPYTDPVIRILPETFFCHCGLMIVLLVLLQVMIIFFVYRRLKHGRHKF